MVKGKPWSHYEDHWAVLPTRTRVNFKNPLQNWLLREWRKGKNTFVLVDIGRMIIIGGARGHYANKGDYVTLLHDQTRALIGRGKVIVETSNVRNLAKYTKKPSLPLYVFK